MMGGRSKPWRPQDLVIGSPDPRVDPEQRIYAFSMVDGLARTFCFRDDEDGRAELAALVRAEQVIKAVIGQEVVLTSQQVSTVRTPGGVTHDHYAGLPHVREL